MVQSFNDDFRVTWSDPAAAAITWRQPRDHFPRPVTPLAQDIIGRTTSPSRAVFVNGFMFAFAERWPPDPPAAVLTRGAVAVWNEDYEPRSRSICDWIRHSRYETMSAADLGAALNGLIQGAAEVCRYTTDVLSEFRKPAFALTEFCQAEAGAEGARLAAELLHGLGSPSANAGIALAKLAEAAASNEELRRCILAGTQGELTSLPGGDDFVAGLGDMLENYGWRAASWGDLHLPTWAEDQTQPLRLVAEYIRDPARSPAAAAIRSEASRTEAEREFRSRLTPNKLSEFGRLLAAAGDHVQINEGRAHWQLTSLGSLRVPILAMGQRLQDTGGLTHPNDVFYLHSDEVERALCGNLAGLNLLVTERKNDFERWQRLVPPNFVGATPSAPSSPQANQRLVREGSVVDSSEVGVLRGIGASRGMARGTARVLNGLDEADRLQPGDILVCATTAPPWTPLFAIAGGVITETGGLLSHSAICAREYAIPCVVGVQNATKRVVDGATISVDGEAGIISTG